MTRDWINEAKQRQKIRELIRYWRSLNNAARLRGILNGK